MFNWLTRTASEVWHDVTGGVSTFVHTVLAGLVGLLHLLFGNVTKAWDELEHATHDLEGAVALYGKSLWGKLAEIIHYWIPKLAFTAWWWVTHPSELSHVLLWHTIGWLEREAWTAGRYLGEFTLALVIHNVRRLALLTETIIAAVL